MWRTTISTQPPGAERLSLEARTQERTMVKDARIEKDKAANSPCTDSIKVLLEDLCYPKLPTC